MKDSGIYPEIKSVFRRIEQVRTYIFSKKYYTICDKVEKQVEGVIYTSTEYSELNINDKISLTGCSYIVEDKFITEKGFEYYIVDVDVYTRGKYVKDDQDSLVEALQEQSSMWKNKVKDLHVVEHSYIELLGELRTLKRFSKRRVKHLLDIHTARYANMKGASFDAE
jgi:hypothetical protein